jgi:hypothetical protein
MLVVYLLSILHSADCALVSLYVVSTNNNIYAQDGISLKFLSNFSVVYREKVPVRDLFVGEVNLLTKLLL